MVAASDRLALEEALEETEHRARRHATVAERRRQREWARQRLCDEWDSLLFAERQELLRQVVERVVVTDDDVRTFLRPGFRCRRAPLTWPTLTALPGEPRPGRHRCRHRRP